MLRTAARPALSVSMGEASTKKPNEWKYVKGINDYGKEQTYMVSKCKDQRSALKLHTPTNGGAQQGWEFGTLCTHNHHLTVRLY